MNVSVFWSALEILQPVLGGHPVLSGHLAIPRGWPLNTGWTLAQMTDCTLVQMTVAQLGFPNR